MNTTTHRISVCGHRGKMSDPKAVRTSNGQHMCSTEFKIVRKSTSMSKLGKGIFVCDGCTCRGNLTAGRAYIEEDTEIKMSSEDAAFFTVDNWLQSLRGGTPDIPVDLGVKICQALGIDKHKPSCTNESDRT